ncbi:MAG: hypothetical protein PHR30_16675 [Gallionellaceae bacterium]|nr:hypothetical protein [Gallionellaceae bacterium]
MSALSKSVTAFALVATLAAGPALAGPFPCMPMQMMSGAPDCSRQAAPQSQACPAPEEWHDQECAGNGQDIGATLAGMAAGGMHIATTVINAIFGTPDR